MTAPLRRPIEMPGGRSAPVPRAIYFGPDSRRAFGWYHAASVEDARDCAVVLCAPHGYESVCSHRALRHWAEGLAASGISVVRFDYHGCGDSAGDDEDPSRLRAWIDSIGDAVDVARTRSGASSVVLAGVRLGATLALAAAVERDDVDALLLWAALPTGRAYLREGRAFTRLMTTMVETRKHTLPDGMEQIGGFVLTRETVQALSAFDPMAAGGGRTSAKAALWIPRDDVSQDASVADRLTQLGVNVERRNVAGYTAMMVDPHQSVAPAQVIETTIRWLRDRYQKRLKPGRGGREGRGQHERELGLAVGTSARDARIAHRPVHESPVTIDGDLAGVIAEPAASSASGKRTGIVLVNAGSVRRIGPNRLYVTLARAWASLGYSVLRMDVGGLGDSDTPDEGKENHPYPGHAVRDIERSVEWLRERGASRVVVAGLCSGAHAAFHAGLEIPNIDGVIVINPIVFYWKPTDALDVSSWLNYNESRHYESAARRWESWVRLLTGRVNVVHVAKTMLTRIATVAHAKAVSALRGLHLMPQAVEDAARDLRKICDRGTDVLLVFSEGDPGLDFLKRHHAGALRRLVRRANFAFHVVANADHTFTPLDARVRVADLLTAHVLEHHDHA